MRGIQTIAGPTLNLHCSSDFPDPLPGYQGVYIRTIPRDHGREQRTTARLAPHSALSQVPLAMA